MTSRRGGSLAAALATLAVLGSAAARGDELEYSVKAEMVERFTRFVDWPEGALGPPDAPFVLCVLGSHPIAGPLGRIAASGRTMKGRPVRLVTLDARGRLEPCHVVFIAGAERARLAEILRAAERRPALTIADTPGFAARGVLVNLYLEEGRVRFEFNLDGVKRHRLKVSPRLLRLGRIVQSEGSR